MIGKMFKKISIFALFLTMMFCIGGYMYFTYEVKANTDFTDTYYSIDLDEKTQRKAVATDAPQITVLTHGLGGNASHWSHNGKKNNLNKYDFGY